ncbi:hypothetical protein CXB36_06945 [Pseudomonas syringae pv. syringae]|nr:hypothetical protein BKC06_005050 [Pseudomonas syringae pv. syringae]POP66280.1 hypothetical protein CXB36_06945 [Pseudomonas syringae pv. syringae]
MSIQISQSQLTLVSHELCPFVPLFSEWQFYFTKSRVVFQIDTGPKAAHQGSGGQISSSLSNASRSRAVAAFRIH